MKPASKEFMLEEEGRLWTLSLSLRILHFIEINNETLDRIETREQSWADVFNDCSGRLEDGFMSVIIINTEQSLSNSHKAQISIARRNISNQTTSNHYYGVSTFPMQISSLM